MKAVFESGQEFFQYRMAETVVQDNSQTLGKTSTTSHYMSCLLPINANANLSMLFDMFSSWILD